MFICMCMCNFKATARFQKWKIFLNKIFCCFESTVFAMLEAESSNSTEQIFTECLICARFVGEGEWDDARKLQK